MARTGLRDHEEAAGYHPVTVEFTTWDHKAYYPGTHEITLRITDKNSGQLLGVQLLGHWEGAIAKRADICAMALYQEMVVSDLLVDLSYSKAPRLAIRGMWCRWRPTTGSNTLDVNRLSGGSG